MDLNQAFKMAVQKFYEGYDYAESKNISLKGKDYEYDFDKLDSVHSEVRKPKKRPYNRKPKPEDVIEDDFGPGVNSGEDLEDEFEIDLDEEDY